MAVLLWASGCGGRPGPAQPSEAASALIERVARECRTSGTVSETDAELGARVRPVADEVALVVAEGRASDDCVHCALLRALVASGAASPIVVRCVHAAMDDGIGRACIRDGLRTSTVLARPLLELAIASMRPGDERLRRTLYLIRESHAMDVGCARTILAHVRDIDQQEVYAVMQAMTEWSSREPEKARATTTDFLGSMDHRTISWAVATAGGGDPPGAELVAWLSGHFLGMPEASRIEFLNTIALQHRRNPRIRQWVGSLDAGALSKACREIVEWILHG